MFNYSDKTITDRTFKLNELFKMIKADKIIKADAENITAVKLSHVLSPATTNLESNESVKEIYIIQVGVNKKTIPEKFIEAFDKQINFQTLFKVCYNEEVRYLCSIKKFSEESEIKILKTYITDWQPELKLDLPITTKLDVVYKEIVCNIAGVKFRQDETFEHYIERQTNIKKKRLEIEKLTKTMNAEKQPNIRMAMNDKIKQLKIELQEMEG